VVPLDSMSVCPDPVTGSATSSAGDDDTVAPPIPNGVNTQLRKILVCLGPSYSLFRGFEDPEDFDFDFDFDFRSVRPFEFEFEFKDDTEVDPEEVEEVEEVDEEEVIRIP
jgi:hypothetical protein